MMAAFPVTLTKDLGAEDWGEEQALEVGSGEEKACPLARQRQIFLWRPWARAAKTAKMPSASERSPWSRHKRRIKIKG
jgi:hypothetical protein